MGKKLLKIVQKTDRGVRTKLLCTTECVEFYPNVLSDRKCRHLRNVFIVPFLTSVLFMIRQTA